MAQRLDTVFASLRSFAFSLRFNINLSYCNLDAYILLFRRNTRDAMAQRLDTVFASLRSFEFSLRFIT